MGDGIAREGGAARSDSSTRESPALLQSLQSHLAIVLPGTIVLFTAFRLLRVAHGDPATAFAIVQTSGTANVLVGLMVSVLPMLAIAVGMTFAYGYMYRGRARPAALLGFTPILLFLPAIVTILLGVLALVMVAIALVTYKPSSAAESAGQRAERRTRKRQFYRVIALSVFVLMGLLTSYLLLATDFVWLPSETVVFRGDREQIVGYVLHSDSDHTVIMREADRQVVIVRKPWQSRTICRVPGRLQGFSYEYDSWYLAPLPGMLNGIEAQPDYEKCPDG